MVNPAIEHLPRQQRRAILALEAKRRASGNWPAWETIPLPNGTGGEGWNKDVNAAHRNEVFCVLQRTVGNAIHLAVSSLSGIRPTWHEMQRIKDELAGEDKTAIEVYPPRSEIVDEADMFHIWVVDPLPFSIFNGERAA